MARKTKQPAISCDILNGWAEIAAFMGWSVGKAQSRREEWKMQGVIFYDKIGSPGRPMVRAFPQLLRLWTMKKTQSGESV